MSSDETQSALSRAFELVEAGQYDDARAILDPILAANPNNADAWWVYAHAVTTPEDGRMALENVIRIDPRYPGAAELLEQARELSPNAAKVTSVPPPPGTIPEESQPEFDFLEPDLDDVQATSRARPVQPIAEQPTSPKRSTALPIVLIAVIAAVIVIGLLVLPNLTTLPTSPTATTIPVVSAPTEASLVIEETEEPTESSATASDTEEVAPTLRATITPTGEGATTEAAISNYPAVSEALTAYPLAQAGIAEVQTTLGNTLLASVCSAPGREMRMLLPQVMNALAAQTESLPETVQAIGVSLVNCDTNTPMLTVAAEVVSAQSFAQGDLSASEFAATWEPQ